MAVLRAYTTRCAACRLRDATLLQAAHIIDDSDSRGVATVVNGIALCAIHQLAYDRNLFGIDFGGVGRRLLHEIDGPMLRSGLPKFHGAAICILGAATNSSIPSVSSCATSSSWPSRDATADARIRTAGQGSRRLPRRSAPQAAATAADRSDFTCKRSRSVPAVAARRRLLLSSGRFRDPLPLGLGSRSLFGRRDVRRVFADPSGS
ncbi:MAG: HNH endonuclease [Vicinamibacteria bacterium]